MTVVKRRCRKCKAEFNAPLKEVNRGNGKFCSRSCCSNYGKPEGKNRKRAMFRARKLWITRHNGAHPICRKCAKKADIHHKDGNDLNNKSSNHDRLCRSHHVELENRKRRIARSKS